MYEFNQNELGLLIVGLRGATVIEGADLMMQNRLLEQFERELMRRFDVYIEDDDKTEEEERETLPR